MEQVEFQHLGKVSNEPTCKVELIEWKGGALLIALDCEEFSSLCPVTSQPDYGNLLIEYIPVGSIIETKSLKLYLQGARNLKAFNEVIIDRIASDLFEQVAPLYIRVTGTFNRRGGISVTASAERGARRSMNE